MFSLSFSPSLSLSLSPSCSRNLPTPPYLSQWKQTTKQAKNLQKVYIIIENFSFYIYKKKNKRETNICYLANQTNWKINYFNLIVLPLWLHESFAPPITHIHVHVTINMKQIYHQQLRLKFGKDRHIKDSTNTAHFKVLIVHALLFNSK